MGAFMEVVNLKCTFINMYRVFSVMIVCMMSLSYDIVILSISMKV